MRRYDYNDLDKFGGEVHDYTSLRIAYITHVDHSRGTVEIKWLDHPGSRSGVQINQSALGSWDFPVVGATVLIKMRNDVPEILRYVPINYSSQVKSGHIVQLYPGEKLLMSYHGAPVVQGNSLPQLVPTGTQIKMDNSGRIIMSTGMQDKFLIDPTDNIIEIDSMNHRISTEAGIIDFGITKREVPSSIDPSLKDTITVFKSGNQAYTELRLRLLEASDNNPATAPEVDNPFIELTMGTALKRLGTIYVPDTVPVPDSGTGNEIAISLKVNNKSNSSTVFLFRVDKSGNVKMEVDGHFTIKCDDIELGGDGLEQQVVLKDFITTIYNSHAQIGNLGLPTGPPLIPAPTTFPIVSQKVKVD